MADQPVHGYARASDGAYIAYLTVGDGPMDIVWQFDWLGNLDAMWDVPVWQDWFRALAQFSRVILHDRRGTGVSSRNVPPPNLETRVSDLLAVLDTVGADQPVVLAGQYEGGTPNVLLAGTHPGRVHSLVWFDATARSTWTPDYPWGAGPDYVAAEAAMTPLWGTLEYGRRFLQSNTSPGDDVGPEIVAGVARVSRLTCTPDVARALADIWYQTDVRSALPTVQVPALLTAQPGAAEYLEEVEHVASMMPHSTVEQIVGTLPGRPHAELVRRFLGVDTPRPSLDSVLTTVLFTDIVSSTQKQADLGDQAWKRLVERHHEMTRAALSRWRGVENDTAGDGFYATFDGPARAIRCALEIADHVLDLGIEVRAGVHTGECEIIDGKAGGIAVSIGARIGALAEPSQVLVSQTVKDLTAGSGIHYAERGEFELKGVPDRWRVYAAARS